MKNVITQITDKIYLIKKSISIKIMEIIIHQYLLYNICYIYIPQHYQQCRSINSQ